MGAKKYTATSLQAAVNKIKEDIGPNAMILSTKRIPRNLRDPYGQDLFEVVAAPHDSDNKELVPQESSGNSESKEIESYEGSVPTTAQDDMDPERIDIETIKAELVSIKEMLYLINRSDGLPGLLHTHPECLNMYAKLVKSGLSERRSQAFMNKGCAFLDSRKPEPKDIATKVLKEILNVINVVNLFETDSKRPDKKHLAAFVGPTGVGKTTTIAKLAAELSLKQKKSVGLVSIDGYRIGALEQLRTYSSIMGLPCLPAFTPEELKLAVKKLKNKDIILIDTAGQSHFDVGRMNELAGLIGGDLSISCHLVLSATTNSLDMKDAGEKFQKLNPESYIFTKFDETLRRGAIIDQVLDLNLPISFVTNGQRVPEDFIQATKKNILKLIFENKSQEI
ncbi:MAG: flagellar biosynthesis protein FlhF [Desulfobacterales bacterium]|nr:flagellar biosynthesis protein FlhF [Desulfobacterales bacterium]